MNDLRTLKPGQVPDDASPLVRGAMHALLRAAARAREVARQTGTRLVIVRDGKIEHVHPDDVPLP